MSVLSEQDIIRYLGNKIFIYPFEGVDKSLNGCCLMLTPSEYAYYVEDGTPKRLHPHYSNPNNKEEYYFLLPEQQTTLVWTKQSVWIDGSLCGSIHSKVNMAARGIGHIGTRVNPSWGGTLSIALHNFSNNKKIKVESCDTIAYMRFHQLKTKSLEGKNIADSRKRASAKLEDAFPGCQVPQELKKWVEAEGWRDGTKGSFEKVLEEERPNGKVNVYKAAKRNNSRLFGFSRWFSPYEPIPWAVIVIAGSTIINSLITLFFR